MGKAIAIVNRKGGVGKTTTAITLAHGLARKLEGEGRGRVLLIDLDPQGNVALSLGLKPNGHDIADLLTGSASLRDCVLSASNPLPDGPQRPNLFIIPASDRLATAKLKLVSQETMSVVAARFEGRRLDDVATVDNLLLDKLGPAKEVFDFVILDCPPSLDMLSNAVYHFADEAIVPVKVDFLGAAGTVRHTENIIAAQESGIDIKISLVVPTFVNPRQVMAREVIQALNKRYGKHRVASPIPTSVKIEQAPADGGKTLFEYAPDSAPAEAYQKLVERVYHG
ncbi:MAG: ParA family protein [Chloroflexi bacterium]|nr:ParA family protein [Chloroflexota bacterium]